MKNKCSIIIAALLAASVTFTSCGKSSSKDSSSEASESSESSAQTSEYVEPSMNADPNAVPASGAAPVLKASDAQGKPGDIVEVTVSVNGADGKWAMCGVHLTYDENMVCVASSSDETAPDTHKGGAIENIDSFIAVYQIGEDRNEYLLENKLNAVFFAAVDSKNDGRDGDIVTFKFEIPKEAEAGAEYEIGFYYRNGDMFTDADKDEAIQDYAFSHYETGTITVL